LAHEISQQPGVVVYSKDRLNIEGGSIQVHDIGATDSTYRFRYTGLKLLIRSAGKYFLVPADWDEGNRITIVLPESDTRLFEFMPQ
jgi:hypothetical protein